MEKITVLGLGYIGLPTALLLANAGFTVNGFDIDNKRMKTLIKGDLPFEEHGLQKLFESIRVRNNFKSTEEIEPADVFIIAVPTPQTVKNTADLSYIFSALESIKTVFKDGDLIILESTVGSLDCDEKIIPRINKIGKKFLFAHVPERAIPGNTLFEMVHNTRVIGCLSKEEAEITRKIYSSFIKGKFILTTPKMAAVSKIMENTYRDINIALANEFAKIADELDFNVWKAIEIANHHPRVNIHLPGPGVGGHCIPIDPRFFIGESTQTKIIPLARDINDGMADYICSKLENLFKKNNIKSPKIGILGYAYKKNVSDFRQSPTERFIKFFEGKYEMIINDPFVTASSRKMSSLEEVLKKSEVIILVTDHQIYQKISFSKYPRIKFVFDSRNLFNSDNFKESNAKLYKLGGDEDEDFNSN